MITDNDIKLIRRKITEMENKIYRSRGERIAHISIDKITQETSNPINYEAEYIHITKIFIKYLMQEYKCKEVQDFITVINNNSDYRHIMGYIRTNSVADNMFLKGDYVLYAMLLEEQVTSNFGTIRGVGKTSRWTKQEHEDMLVMRAQGLTFKEIAKHYKANPSTILNAIKRFEKGAIKNFKVKEIG